jgi:hypothetical protein
MRRQYQEPRVTDGAAGLDDHRTMQPPNWSARRLSSVTAKSQGSLGRGMPLRRAPLTTCSFGLSPADPGRKLLPSGIPDWHNRAVQKSLRKWARKGPQETSAGSSRKNPYRKDYFS